MTSRYSYASAPVMCLRLAGLEARFGARLIERNSRSFRLTEEGEMLRKQAQRIVAEVEKVEAELRIKGKHRSRKPRLPSVGAQETSALDTALDI